MSRALFIQLARLGDLIQVLPAISAVRSALPHQPLDLLCAAPLTSIGRLFSDIQRVYPWEGERWHSLATKDGVETNQGIKVAEQYLSDCDLPRYELAYNLNDHPRSILAAHLLSEQAIGAGDQGPLNPRLPQWVAYLRQVARNRGGNRIHLSDAFCGVCEVSPPTRVPHIQASHVALPLHISQLLNQSSLKRIGIVLGAGDGDRRVPLSAWRQLIEACINHLPDSLCVLIGGGGERDAALALEDQLSSRYLSRLLNCVGRTTLPELAHVLNQCQWVVGSDTGPLHLGTACGARAIGWYFSRARVHETGPYGIGHYVWQYRGIPSDARISGFSNNGHHQVPSKWPILETLQLIQDQHDGKGLLEWELWNSKRDHRGMFYTNGEASEVGFDQRAEIWNQLASSSSNFQVASNGHAKIAG